MNQENTSSENGTRPSVAAIVLNWNNYEDTARCLRSLSQVTYPNLQVFVVDNNSIDGSGERLSEEFESHRFIFNKSNLGFAGGCNSAINEALDQGFDYVLLLNNDAEVDPEFLTPLVETAESNGDIAAVGGIVRNTEGEIQSAGGYFTPWLTTLRHNRVPESEVYETEFITGAMMLIDTGFLKSVGGLNDDYFFGMEDQELCWKAIQRGYRLLIDSRSVIYHAKGGSAEEQSPFRYYHDTRNRLRFVAENVTMGRKILFYTFFLLSRSYRFVQWTVRRRTELVRATLSGVLDHVRNADYRMLSDF